MRPIKILLPSTMNYRKSINEVFDWCDKNAMISHPAKTKSMLLATRQKHQLRPLILNLNFKDNHIEQVHEHRHLIIIIDDEFSWRPYITSTCKTIIKNNLKKIVPVVTAQTVRRHFQAKVISLCSHFASPNICIYCLGRL